MKGKNRGKTYDSRGQRAKQSSPSLGHVGPYQGTRDSLPSSESPPICESVPQQVGSDVSFFPLADDSIEPLLILPVLKCMLVPRIRRRTRKPNHIDSPSLLPCI